MIEKSMMDPKELERQILSSTVEKSEREWWAHREISRLKEELAEAVRYLREGKAKFSPNTTNSDVDSFLERHKEAKV